MKVTLPLPPTTNSTYKVGQGRMYKSKNATDWRWDAFCTIKETLHERFTGPVKVDIVFFIKISRDVDGAVKTVLDVLQETQVVLNDSQVHKLSVSKEMISLNPCVEVTIEAIP